MLHDFVLTKNYLVFIDCPAVFDLTATEIIQWRPELNTRIGIISRNNGSKIKWLETDSFFAFHFANAYELENQILIDYVHHQNLGFTSKSQPKAWPTLYQLSIDLKTNQIKNESRDDNAIEFPRIHENYNSLPNRFIYAPAKDRSFLKDLTIAHPFSALIKYDSLTKKNEVHDFGKDCEIGEAVFAPRSNHKSEDDGYVMLFVYGKN